MSLAQSEETRRRAVRGFLERMEPDTRSLLREDLWSRAELFGVDVSVADKGFQQRCLTRMCVLGVLDSLLVRQGSTSMRFYALKDSVKVLDALTDDEALTQLIWKRPGMDLFNKSSSDEQSSLENFVPVSASPVDGASGDTVQTLTDVAAASVNGLPELTLKLLAGLVESVYYLRVKIEGIEGGMKQLEQAIHNLNSQFEVVALEPSAPSIGNGARNHK
jgi:hypothetical protein